MATGRAQKRCTALFPLWSLKDTHREKALSNETPALTKSTDTVIWVVGTTNQLCIRYSSTETEFFKK